MATIISNDGSIILNGGKSISKGLILCSISNGLVLVRSSGGDAEFRLDYRDTTVDGDSFASAEELLAKISSFKRGGGDGEWVAWSDVSMMPEAGKVPVFSPQGLLSTGMPLFPENAVPLAYVDLILQRFIGVFDSEVELNTAHPTGAETQYAYVRDIDSTGDIFRYYYWNDMAEAWIPLNKKEDDIYSHEETSTGKIWYDGKPIFRQVFSDINIKDLSSVNIPINTISTNVTSISYILNNSGLIHSNHSNLNVRAQDSVIRIATSSQFTTETSITLIVEYTK